MKLRYRGREVTAADVALIRKLIADNPTASRRALSKLLCEAWNWRQPNGVLRDMVCRGLMLELHRSGHIELPPVRRVNPNPLVQRRKPAPVEIDTTPLRVALAEIRPLEFRQVRRSAEERIFNGLMEEHHYLRYTQPVGEHLKYLVFAGDRPISCLAWCSAPRHLGPRDRFIAWSAEARRRNIRFLAYNTRFLILPWVQVLHLASHILGTTARLISRDWEKLYAHPVYFLETFVDPERNRGTCYRAANWIPLGRTTGRGHNAPTMRPRVPVKEILGYPLSKHFRDLLSRIQ
ncbi:MAG: Druantia anti-phage system protein DruA [Candidatus Krumholzibacteriia bacterium]